MHRFIALWLLVLAAGLGTPAQAAEPWVEKVVAETRDLLTGRCVSPSSPNSVYILNATSGEHMSATDERIAVNKLTSALRSEGWIQVIHGSALPYETYTRENNTEGRQQMYDLLTNLSDATITIFVVPRSRFGAVVQSEVVFLARSQDDGTARLTCAYEVNVDIPVQLPARCPDPATATEIAICTNDDLYAIDATIGEMQGQLKGVDEVSEVISERTRIRDLCGANMGCLERVLRETLEILTQIKEDAVSGSVGPDVGPTPPNSSICNPAADTLAITNVNEYATLRSGTSYDTPVVVQVLRGAMVEYTGSRRLAKPMKLDRCDALCSDDVAGTLEYSDKQSLERCIRDDVFWLNVRTSNGEVGWMSAKYLRIPTPDAVEEVEAQGNIRVGVENDCRVVLDPHRNKLEAAETFVQLYYADLSSRRVRCAENRWLDPPDDLAEMVVDFGSATLSYNELDRAQSDTNSAQVDVVAHIETTTGERTAWRVTLSLVPSRSGWLIARMDGYEM